MLMRINTVVTIVMLPTFVFNFTTKAHKSNSLSQFAIVLICPHQLVIQMYSDYSVSAIQPMMQQDGKPRIAEG